MTIENSAPRKKVRSFTSGCTSIAESVILSYLTNEKDQKLALHTNLVLIIAVKEVVIGAHTGYIVGRFQTHKRATTYHAQCTVILPRIIRYYWYINVSVTVITKDSVIVDI